MFHSKETGGYLCLDGDIKRDFIKAINDIVAAQNTPTTHEDSPGQFQVMPDGSLIGDGYVPSANAPIATTPTICKGEYSIECICCPHRKHCEYLKPHEDAPECEKQEE